MSSSLLPLGDNSICTYDVLDSKWIFLHMLQFIMEGRLPSTDNWVNYKSHAEQFICNTVQKGYHNVKMTRGGALWWLSWNNFQYTTSALLLTISYGDWLNAARSNLNCPNGQVSPDQLIAFARLQVHRKQFSDISGF